MKKSHPPSSKQGNSKCHGGVARYVDFFELAPMGYIILSEPGLILEANLTAAVMLGNVRDLLIGELFSSFILEEDRSGLENCCKRILETGQSHGCELRMVKSDATVFWARLEANSAKDADGTTQFRIVVNDICVRKQVEESLRIKSIVFDASIAAISVANVDGVITEANAAFLLLWGYAGKEDVIGKPIPYFLNDPDEAASIIASLNASGRWEGHYTAKRKDGSNFVANGLATVVCDETGRMIGYQSAVLDITEQRLAEQTLREWNQNLERRVEERTLELQQSKARFRQLAEATFEGIAVSENGILLDGNEQLAAIHSYELAEMIGRPIEDFIAPESRALVAQWIRGGDEADYEYIAVRKDGSTFPAEVHGRMGIWGGQVTRISAIRDVSGIKETAARFQAQQTELEQAHRLALLSEISAGILHQIGQPLCAMGVNSSVAMIRANGCQVKPCGVLDVIQDINEAATCAREAVIHLRTLIQSDSRSTRVRINFNDWVADALRRLRLEAETRHVLLTVELDPNPLAVFADAVQLKQILLILVRNAFDACAGCPPERKRIAITTRTLADEGVELRVRDAGTGITAEAMSRMFSPFFTTKTDGMGIGLRLSRTIVEAHGGRIEGVNNADGFGATFRFILPGGHCEAFYAKV